MKVAVVNEVSQKSKNKYVINALEKYSAQYGYEVINAGMTGVGEETELSYIHTGLISALLLNSGAADYVLGGCGTGQGYLNSVMQYPGVFCGLINEPLDAWLFRQINGGNCLSLALAKGFGWAGEINVEWIVEKFFGVESGAGFPADRKAPQKVYRDRLTEISTSIKKTMPEILRVFPYEELKTAMEFPGVFDKIKTGPKSAELVEIINKRLAEGK